MARLIATGRQSGFTYLVAMIWVFLAGFAAAVVSDFWHLTRRREKEVELIFIGHQFKSALERYSLTGSFPKRLEDLVEDNRSATVRRYLRKIYVDPMTGKARWGTVTLADGQIIGVFSLSAEEPLKKSGFGDMDARLEGKAEYSEWVFLADNAPTITLARLPLDSPGGKPGMFPGFSSTTDR